MLKRIIIFFIRVYQRTLSLDHGLLRYRYPNGYCRFYPTCSEYARQAIEKRGVVRGILFGLHRILRCNPWSKGGIDTV